MKSDQLQELAISVLEGRTNLDDLPADQVDAVIMRTYECAVEAIDTNPNCSEGVFQLVEALQPVYDEILGADSEKFEQAILEAEKRGSYFWAPKEFMLH
jgi:hypothetical protein